MKKEICLFLWILIPQCFDSKEEQKMKEKLKFADTLFEKGNFQSASKEYQDIFDSSHDEKIKWKAFFRLCESLTHLFKYGEASQLLLSTPLPEKNPHRIRVMFLRAEILQNFLMQYSNVLDEDRREGEKDVFNLTEKEVFQKIDEAYGVLWSERNNLIKMKVKDEDYFLNLSGSDTKLFPTMLDVVVYSWVNYLNRWKAGKNDETKGECSWKEIVNEKFDRKVNLNDPVCYLVAEIMEETGRMEMDDQRSASEYWRVRRIMLPFNYAGQFSALAKDEKEAKEARKVASEILLRWFEKFETDYGKAEAGYNAGILLKGLQKYGEAVKIFKKVENLSSNEYARYISELLRKELESPSIILEAKPVPPPGKGGLKITTRNLKKVYFSAYKIDPDKYRKEVAQNKLYMRGWSYLFSYPDHQWLEFLLKIQPTLKWDIKISDKGDYMPVITQVDNPPLNEGVYLIVASEKDSPRLDMDNFSATFFNVTNLVLIGSAGISSDIMDSYENFLKDGKQQTVQTQLARFYTLDARSGAPVSGAKIETKDYKDDIYNGEDEVVLTTNENGVVFSEGSVNLNPIVYRYGAQYGRYLFDPLARKGESYAYLPNEEEMRFVPENPLKVFIETDRPIYRPGQTVKAKVVVVWKTPSGASIEVLANKVVVDFKVLDASGKEFFKTEKKVGNMASVDAEFQIPEGHLLGLYTIDVVCRGKGYENEAKTYISVEEYKKPEFEIVFDEAKEPWKYNEKTQISGMVKYYFGGAVGGAKLKYKITRKRILPWFYRRWFLSEGFFEGKEVAWGETEADGSGKFTISFTPSPDPERIWGGKIPDFSDFIVEVEGMDRGGRVIKESKSFRAGSSGLYIQLEGEKGFFFEGEEIKVNATLFTINDTPVSGRSDFEVFRVEGQEVLDSKEKEGTSSDENKFFKGDLSLEMQLEKTPNGKKEYEGSVEHSDDGKAKIVIKSLPSGFYRLVVTTRDKWGGEVRAEKILIVDKAEKGKTKNIKIPEGARSVTLSEMAEYDSSQTARFLFGSSAGPDFYTVEIWAGPYFVKSEMVKADEPLVIYEVPVSEKMKGGMTLRWFAVKNMEIYKGEQTVLVPWKEKKLGIEVSSFSEKVSPGSKVSWNLKLVDFKGNPVKGEILAFMYDKSLEYYWRMENPWLDELYKEKEKPLSIFESVFNAPVRSYYREKEGLLEKLQKKWKKAPQMPKPPGLRTKETWVYGTGLREEYAKGPPSLKAPLKDVETREKGLQVSRAAPMQLSVEAKAGVRKEFADTAFFYPYILTDNQGKATLTYIAPEQLTAWKARFYAFTADAKEASAIREVITRKEFMVRADIPRFFREGDKGTVTAMVHNESDNLVKGDVYIDITKNGKSIRDELGVSNSSQHFDIEPGSLKSFNWMVKIPRGTGTYKVLVVAKAGDKKDAEERELPILPSYQRVIESTVSSLSGNETKKIALKLPPEAERKNELVSIQVDPQLPLTLLGTIPFIVSDPYQNTINFVNRYVTLAILNKIYSKYPSIAKNVSKIPKRKGIILPWEKDDPRRLMQLIESPWSRVAEGYETDVPLIDLLDPQIVESVKKETISELRAMQNYDGAFPWIAGGIPDLYMTLYALSGFAEAYRYGVEIPFDIVEKAIDYVLRTVPQEMGEDISSLSLAAYGSYVMTSFPVDKFFKASSGYDSVHSWVKTMEKKINALTPLGKAYLAVTLFRLGEKKRGKEVLEMAMDGAKEDPTTGIYWAPEKYSWVWYSDSIEKHTFFLNALEEMDPKNSKIPGIVKWLLFNKKGNVWKSVKATTSAVFSLLKYFEKTGAIKDKDSFAINWGNEKYQISINPEDWIGEPFRWIAKDSEINEGLREAVIDKKGPGTAFASMTWIYSTENPPESESEGLVKLQRKFYRRVRENGSYRLEPVESGGVVYVGDEIVVELKIESRSQFEYVHIVDPLGAGFESQEILSRWKFSPLACYEEHRDSLTNFFLQWLPQGEYTIKNTIRPAKPGTYRIEAALLQSMYAPEITARTKSMVLNVAPEK